MLGIKSTRRDAAGWLGGRSRSLRLNLILWFTFVFTLVLAVSDYITYKALRGIVLAGLDSSLVSMATLEKAAFEQEGGFDLEDLSRHLRGYPQSAEQFVQVIDSSGSVLSQSGLSDSTLPAIDGSQLAAALSGQVLAVDGAVDGNPVRVAAVPGGSGGKRFVVVLGTKADKVRQTATQIGVLLFIIDLLAVAASAGGGYLIVGRALKPVDHITERAHIIGEGNLHQRLDYVDSSEEMVKLTSVLNEMFDKLEELFESQTRFVQDASHEIRSPLAALRCRLEVALRQHRSAQEYCEVIEGALRDASRLGALADDLLLLARADSSGLSMEMKEISVSDVVSTVHRQLLPLAEAHRVQFSLDTEPACLAYGDQFRLNQAFRNIAENALKYTPQGGSVAITVRSVGQLIRTDIKDTGIGISEDEQTRIFRRFYRVDHARSRGDGGAGLGLAICDHIVRAHDGRIEVASAPGHGASFSVYLPSARALDEDGA